MRALLPAALLLCAACSGPALLNTAAPNLRGEFELTRNVAYGDLSRQRMDIYTPDGEGPHPMLLFVHGGSWERGDKDVYGFAGRRFAAEGYLTAVVNYRLAPEHGYDAFMADVAAATAAFYRQAEEHGGDPGRLFLAGHSAGAYNVVQLALAPEFLEAEGLSPHIITGVSSLAGPFSFLPLDSDATKAAFGGADDLEATQPVNRVTADAPPMILQHGADDDVVRPKNATALEALLEDAGVQAEAVIYPGLDHAEIIIAVAFPDRAPVVEDMTAFFEALPSR